MWANNQQQIKNEEHQYKTQHKRQTKKGEAAVLITLIVYIKAKETKFKNNNNTTKKNLLMFIIKERRWAKMNQPKIPAN